MNNQFRPENSALVLIDHQIGTLQLVKTLNPADVERLVVALAKTAKALKLPVILTTSVETVSSSR
jgi:nicotinamidase-related amidase